MEAVYKYKDINQTLRGIRRQIIDSFPYCYQNLRGFRSPDDLFIYLKQITRFKFDPKDEELLQTAQTLLENNYHGEPGAGDCDCFVILAHACFIVNGWGKQRIILTGRSTSAPVHIYSQVHDGNRWRTFDLTNASIDHEREYPYKQILPLTFEK